MDDSDSVGFEIRENQEVHRSSAIRRIKWFGILALGFGTIAFAIAVFSISHSEPRRPFVLVLLAVLYVLAAGVVLPAIRSLGKIQNQLLQENRNLEARIDQDRKFRQDLEWIDSAENPIIARMNETIVPDEIAEMLVEGLGRTVGADFVHFYSLADFKNSKFLKQWSRTVPTRIDMSKIANYESRLVTLAERLEEGSQVITVADARLSMEPNDWCLDLVPKAQEPARSWILAPLGDVKLGLGYVWIGMAETVREWSSAEIAFVKKFVADVTQILSRALIFNQSMQIVANDAEVERLVELDKVKNSFIENMNHELRTPLASIIGYLELIMEDVNTKAEPELAASLAAMQRNAQRLQILIDNMMQISKTDFEHVPLVISRVDLGHLLGDIANSLQLSAEDSGVAMTLRLDSPTDDLIVDGDVNQLEQVFVNLVSNAIKFTPRGGSVTITACRFHAEGDYVEVKVIDTGIGIPIKEFPNVFQRFFRASTATSASIPGFGIGLSLVQPIVREHKGTVTFESLVGKGTTFVVKLPVVQVNGVISGG